MAYEKTEIAVKVLTLVVGVAALGKGLLEYSKANRTKRAEFLLNLVNQFDSKTYFRSKRLLDDFIVSKKTNDELKVLSPDQVRALPCYHLTKTLRDHKEATITDEDELMLRREADKLLDFFSRLSYYYDNGLITSKELGYFEYYLHKINYLKPKPKDHEQERLQAFKSYIAIYFKPADFERLFWHLNA